jgi:hypothetical protein
MWHEREVPGMSEKFQIPSSKSQANPKFTNHQTGKRRENVAPFRWDFLIFFLLGISLGFGIWTLGF